MKLQTVLTFVLPFAAVLATDSAADPPTPVGPPIPPGAFVTPYEEYFPGDLREIGLSGLGPAPAPAPAFPEKPCDSTRSAACTSCTQLKVCITTDSNMDATNPRKNCPVGTPYCSMSATFTGAICQRTPDAGVSQCVPAASTFPCTGIGFYPDPNSCQVYHYCSAQGAMAQDYDCPDGYKFSSKVSGCVAQAGKCPTVTCPPMANIDSIYQAYPDETMYYVHCTYDTMATPVKITPLIFSCGQGSAYNPKTDQCVFTCPKEGNFVNTANPRQYHQCFTQAGKLTYREKVCKTTEKFSMASNMCV